VYHTTIYRQEPIYRFGQHVVPYNNLSVRAYLPVWTPRCTIQHSIGKSLFTSLDTTLYHSTIFRQEPIYRFGQHVVPYNTLSVRAYLPVWTPRCTIQQSIGKSLFTGLDNTLYHTKLYRQEPIYRFGHHVVPYNNLSARAYLPVSAPRFTPDNRNTLGRTKRIIGRLQ